MAANQEEKLLFPSEWTKRFDSSAAALDHVNTFYAQETKENSTYLRKKDVRYGTGEKQLLDIYYENEENETPIIVFVHGGYWQEFSKDLSAFWIGPYVEKGYRVILIGYDLCPDVTLAELIKEIKSSFKYVLQYAEDTMSNSICIMGHSAGAHLTMAALDKELVQSLSNINLIKGVFLMAGIYDLNPLLSSSVNENNKLTLDESNVKQLSPTFHDFEHLKEVAFKIYSCAAEHDSPLFVEQTEALDKHFKQFGVNSEYKFVKDVDHFNIVENLVNDDYDMTKCLLKCLN